MGSKLLAAAVVMALSAWTITAQAATTATAALKDPAGLDAGAATLTQGP